MPMNEATRHAMLNAVFRAVPLAGGTVAISLHTGDPGSTGTNEVSGGSYARQTPTIGAASGAQSSNTAAINFTDLPAVTVSHVGVWAGGTFRWGAAFTSPRSYGAGDTATIAIGQLVLVLTGSLTVAVRNALLDALLRNVSYSVSAVYASLHTGSPSEGGSNEVAGGTYARQLIAFNAPSAGQIRSTAVEEWPGMPAVTASHGGLWDASTSGNFLLGQALQTSRVFQAGDVARLAAEAFVVGV